MPSTDVPSHSTANAIDGSKDWIDELTACVEGEVRTSYHDRMLYATDASIYQVEPLAVVIPSSIADAARAVQICSDHGVAMLPRGGGTSLAGQCTNRAVVIDFSPNCRGVIDIDEARQRCRVEPGITIDELNDQLVTLGLFFPPDPATSRHANIGGCIGNNAAGARSIRYGRTSEHLLGVDVILADGTRLTLDADQRDARAREMSTQVAAVVRAHAELIRDRFPKTIRRNAGYALDTMLDQLDHGGIENLNLAHLVCGSEGTLAITLSAELALSALPIARGLAIIAFASVTEAIEAVGALLETEPTAIELLDDMVLSLARKHPAYRATVQTLPQLSDRPTEAVLYVEYTADSDPAELGDRFAALRSRFSADRVVCLSTPTEMQRAWDLRKAGEPLLHSIPGARKPVSFVEDNAVPVEHLAAFVDGFRRIVDQHNTRAAFWAHASVGVLHVRPLLDLTDPADRQSMVAMAQEVADLARSLSGVPSGEHGDGRVRGPLLEHFYGPQLMDAFARIKHIFDPHNLLNPGNIVRPDKPASIITHLRVLPEPDQPAHIPTVETYYDYGSDSSLGDAVTRCNGAGICRKKTGGTMCPSYMATLDERHSTRGRGNALRLAITGQLDSSPPGRPAWDDPETIKTLDLCLSCKACKAECPSNVDIAQLKAEYLAQKYRRDRPSLATLAFGHVHRLNRIASLTPRLATALSRSVPGRWLAQRMLGLDPRRTLPPWQRPLFRRWPADDPTLAPDAPRVVFLADSFTLYQEPAIGLAAKRVLEAFGYRVSLYRGTDFGRALISMGLLQAAIDDAQRHLDRLAPMLDDSGIAGFVMLEPSCLSSVRDDWLSLKIDRPIELRQRLAQRTTLLESFLHTRWDDHPRTPELDLSNKPDDTRILFHGHCHQKALWGDASSTDLLGRLIGDRLEVLDAGCCGMAGSFGYTTSRYDLSMAIGEQRLFPAVRAHKGIVVAPGTSCRHQIHDGTNATALHPAELIAQMIVE